MKSVGSLSMMVVLAFRNLFSHVIKNVIVGLILIFGAFLIVVGTSILDSVESAMSNSIISSLAGHVQVYSKDARDDLALFGGNFMGSEDIGIMPNFGKVKSVVGAVPNVKAVVPMGIGMAATNSGNEMDRILTSLRVAVEAGNTERIPIIVAQVRANATSLREEAERRLPLSADVEKVKTQMADLARAASDEFWVGFDEDTEAAITFLESRIAPVAPDDPLVYIRYVGTDLHQFKDNFDRFAIVRGEMVPQGKRGFLLNHKFYEDWVKNKAARELDQLKEEIEINHKTIADDPKLAAKARRVRRVYKQITFQLEPKVATEVVAALKPLFPDEEAALEPLVQALLTVDDANFAERYKVFYEVIAPRIELYKIPIGGTLTARTYTKSGYVKSVNVRVYGTFQFNGLESSDLAGSASLVDMVTFRELYGQVTPEMVKETKAIREEVGIKDVAAASAEDDLFGGSGELVADAKDETTFDEFEGVDIRNRTERRQLLEDLTFDTKVIEEGLALNAAVILHDATKLAETQAAIVKATDAAGLDLKAVDWQTASGMVGQFIVLIKLVLYLIIGVTFIIALVIINNSMVMATMERVTEIGTMRAIGARRGFVMVMFVLEMLVLGVIAGALGSGLGGGIVGWLGQVGIPATDDVTRFLFSGPRLFPTVSAAHLLGGLVTILIVAIISTLYPALIATRIAPVVAMQARE